MSHFYFTVPEGTPHTMQAVQVAPLIDFVQLSNIHHAAIHEKMGWKREFVDKHDGTLMTRPFDTTIWDKEPQWMAPEEMLETLEKKLGEGRSFVGGEAGACLQLLIFVRKAVDRGDQRIYIF